MNEILRRALLQAQLSEDDVAARLAVDPKTARRWTEGRLPYPRHRWELARLLGRDEADLWPQANAARSHPEEVRAVYAHRAAVPSDVWLHFFSSAEREIGILATSGRFLGCQPIVMEAIEDRARAGITLRICLSDADLLDRATTSDHVLSRYAGLREYSAVEIRKHAAVLNSGIYAADDELLVCQCVYGVPENQAPVLHLSGVGDGELVATYLGSFQQAWNDASPLD